MEVTLKPDNRKATIVENVSDSLVKVQLEDGRQVTWRKDKINMPEKEGEETLKMVVIPAIKRLEEMKSDYLRIVKAGEIINEVYGPVKILAIELFEEARTEFEQKWGSSENNIPFVPKEDRQQ